MLKICRDKWNLNKDKLRKSLSEDRNLNDCDYGYLVKKTIDIILEGEDWDTKNISVIDNGDYQGTLLFVIPKKCYQPSEYEYLITYANYGSCSGCDTLLGIQNWHNELTPPTKGQVEAFMKLCEDLLCNIVKPYDGWYKDDYVPYKEVA